MVNPLDGPKGGPYSKETLEVESLKKFNTIFSKIQEGGNAGKIYIDGDNGVSIDTEESSDGNEIITITEWIGKSNGAANGGFELIKDKNGNFKKLEGTTNEEVTYEEVINKIIPEIEKKIRDRNDYLKASDEFENIFSNIKKGAGNIYRDGDNEISIYAEESPDGNKSINISKWINRPNGAATSSLGLIKDKNGSFVLKDRKENKKLSVRELSEKINNIKRDIEEINRQQWKKKVEEVEEKDDEAAKKLLEEIKSTTPTEEPVEHNSEVKTEGSARNLGPNGNTEPTGTTETTDPTKTGEGTNSGNSGGRPGKGNTLDF